MEQKIKDLRSKFEKELENIKDLSELEDVRVAYLGKKGSVTDLLKAMKELSVEDKKAFGQKVNELKGAVAQRIAEKTAEMKEKDLTLVQATEQMGEIIKKFKKVSDVEDITKTNIAMKELETHGDEIHHRAMYELFSGKYEALDVIKLRDMYKEIENALDACFNVSDTVLNVVLKQS